MLGLANDYRYFGEKASLEAARKLADFIINRWSAEPDRFPGGTGKRANMYGVTTGLDAALADALRADQGPAILGLLRPLQAVPVAEVERADQDRATTTWTTSGTATSTWPCAWRRCS